MLDKTTVNQVINHFNSFEIWLWTSGLGIKEQYKAMKMLVSKILVKHTKTNPYA